MAYEFDVFISYKNHSVTNPWVIKFAEQLQYWLTQELGGNKPRIFFDKAGSINIGARWPAKLKTGLQRSKCILCIWTPEYFRSNWCLSEWKSFELRDNTYNNSGQNSLIIPIRFHDGNSYPEDARNRQAVDMSEFAITIDGFWKSEKAIGLIELIRDDLCADLARAINAAPEFEDNFPLVEVQEDNPNPPLTERLKL